MVCMNHVFDFHCITKTILFTFRVEKYRPNTLNDLISHADIIQTSIKLLAIIIYGYQKFDQYKYFSFQ